MIASTTTGYVSLCVIGGFIFLFLGLWACGERHTLGQRWRHVTTDRYAELFGPDDPRHPGGRRREWHQVPLDEYPPPTGPPVATAPPPTATRPREESAGQERDVATVPHPAACPLAQEHVARRRRTQHRRPPSP